MNMGLNFIGSTCECKVMVRPEPTPKMYVLRAEVIGNHIVAEVRYTNFKNYEGRKILVFKDTKIKSIKWSEPVDPHFCENCDTSPFARFVPTEEGWEAAKKLAEVV